MNKAAIAVKLIKSNIILKGPSTIIASYDKKIAINTNTVITATVPQRTNLVKLFHVFLWLSFSIKFTFVWL